MSGPTHTLKLGAHRILQRFQQNPYQYAFDLYLRGRDDSLPIRWDRVNVPHRPGLVTIVLPCYNGADLLQESLDSMLAQTYQDIEIIAINDGSSDGTAETLEAYARRDPRITVLHQENRKLPRTLSRGFRHANGEFLTWTSVDNRMKPNCIADMVESLRRHPDWDMIYANIDIIGEDGQPLRNTDWYSGYQVPPGSEHVHLPVDTAELNTWPNNYIGAAFMYRARVAWTIQDYSPIRFLTEDYDYWMRVNELMKLRHADFSHCIYDYRFHSKSLTSKDKELGITRNRVKLMVFDEFRRSFLLSKCLWSVSSDGSDAAKRAAGEFLRELATRNAIVKDAETLASYSLSTLWMPIAAVHFAGDAQLESIAPAVPASACRIFIAVGGDVLPERPGEWSLYITTQHRDAASLPRLDDYKGWYSIPEIADLASFCDIETKNGQLAALELAIASPVENAAPRMSVVVCTYRRSSVLRRALSSLLEQSLAKDLYEVIVVNNDPAENHPRTIADELLAQSPAHERPPLRVVDCPLPGLSHARNVGLSESRGEYVVFVDDDAIANVDCLEWLYKAFAQHPNAGVIGGHITLNVPEPRPEVCPPGREALWSQYLTNHGQFTEMTYWWQFPYGALWGARRTLLFEMGGFRCNLGRIGNDFGGGEEIVASTLAQKLGYTVAIEPRAEVLHDVEPHRYSLEHVRKTIRAAALVNYRMQVSLHLPKETGLASEIRSIASPRGMSRLLRAVRKHTKPSIEHVYTAAYAEAQLATLRERMRDFVRKFSRPRTSWK
jgi:glycosyltransferase involved in cell wall biosynthesis